MSTHNIGFYEEISKIITFKIIIKYAPYFFSCSLRSKLSPNHACLMANSMNIEDPDYLSESILFA